jgi:hypothetical protein
MKGRGRETRKGRGSRGRGMRRRFGVLGLFLDASYGMLNSKRDERRRWVRGLVTTTGRVRPSLRRKM